jgi:hypothetical protein
MRTRMSRTAIVMQVRLVEGHVVLAELDDCSQHVILRGASQRELAACKDAWEGQTLKREYGILAGPWLRAS